MWEPRKVDPETTRIRTVIYDKEEYFVRNEMNILGMLYKNLGERAIKIQLNLEEMVGILSFEIQVPKFGGRPK